MQRMSSKDEQMLRASMLFDGQCHQIEQDDYELLASDEVRTHLQHWSIIGSALRHELPSKVDPAFASKVMARIESSEETQVSVEKSDELPSLLSSRSAFRSSLAAYARNQQQTSDVGPYETSAVGAYEAEQDVGAYDQPVGIVGPYEQPLDKVGPYEQPMDQVGPYESKAPAGQPVRKKSGWLSLKRAYVFASQIAIAASVAILAVVGLQTYNASDMSVENPASTSYTNTSAIGGLSLASYQNSDSDVIMQLNSQLPKRSDTTGGNEMQADLKKQQQEEIERINLYVQGYVFDTAANN